MRHRPRPSLLIGVALVSLLFVSACSSGDDSDDPTPDRTAPQVTEAASDAPTATGTREPAAEPSPTASAANAAADTEHDGERALEHVRALAGDIGPRVSGTLRAAEAVAGLRFGGTIAVARRDDVLFQSKHTNAAAGGAVGLIIVNNPTRPFRGGNLLELAAMPVVMVEAAAAAVIADAIAAGEPITITVTPSSSTPAANVIARPAAGETCEILVGGHHDSVPGSPGANDNGSGSANVLELARAFAADGLDDGLCFATFGAEESGLNGSRALAALWDSTGELPRFMINFDVTGRGDLVELIGVGALVERGLSIAKGMGIPARAATLSPNTGSDHQSFAARNVPVLFFTSGDFREIHSPDDVLDVIDPAGLDLVGDLGLAVLVDLLAEIAGGRAQT